MSKINYKYLTTFGLASIIAILGVCLVIVCLIDADASATSNSSEDNVAITIPVACTLVSSGNNSHSAAIVNGTYETDIGTTNLKVTCNDNQGFSIYAAGYTGNEIGATNSTKLVGTSASNNATIDTGTATGPVGGNDNSNWAMKLNTTTSPTPTYPITLDNNYNSYSIVPTSYTKVAHRDSGTDIGTSAVGSTLTTTYAAYISKLQYPDTYTGQVKYTLVHPSSEVPLSPQPAVAGYIVYHANASDATGTMGNQSASDGNDVELYASNFSRQGYGFAGWSDAYDYATNPNANFYGPNQTITVPTGTTANGLSLYAVWIKSAGSLQSNAITACNGLTEDPNDGTADLSSVTALTDERDNQTYAIAKLADGKCWMIENLRLDNTVAHNTDGSLSQGYNSSFIGLADPESANFTDSTTANSLYSTDGSTAAPAITGINTGYRFPRYNNNNTNSRQSSSSYSTSGNTYSMGNYYTWPAAIADTTYYSTRDQSIENTSLCPTGWRLPKGGQATVNTTADFYILGKALMNNQEPDQNATSGYGYYGNTLTNTAGDTATKAFRKYPNNFLYSGNFVGSSANSRGNYGSYWLSTVRVSDGSYTLSLYSSYVYPGTDYNYKYYGRAIRCTLGS